MAIDTGFVIVYFIFSIVFSFLYIFPYAMQSEMIGTYFSHKKTDTSLLYLNLKTNFMKLRFVIRQEIVLKKNQKISWRRRNFRLRVFRFLELSPSHLIDYCGV